jgi:hypothetical protein
MRLFFAVPALLIAMSGPAAAVQLLINGDFETGTYAGWSANVQAGSFGDLFLATPGANSPASGNATAPNALGGNFYSVTDQGGGGAYALVQSFTVPLGATSVILSFQMFANDQSGVGPIINPAGLDYTAGANQHALVDILINGAGAFTNAASDIVTTLYQGIDAGPNPNPYTNYLFDLTALLTPGATYQIRFGEVDNQFFFQHGVDNVSIDAVVGDVPAPAALGLFGLALGALALRRR